MGWEPMPPLRTPRRDDWLLGAMEDRDVPAAQRTAAQTYDFTLPADRWTLVADGFENMVLSALLSLSLALLVLDLVWPEEVPSTESAVAGSVAVGLALVSAVLLLAIPTLQGPQRRSVPPLWVWLAAGAAVLLTVAVLPREWVLALPAVVAALAAVPVARAVRDFRPTETPIGVHAPAGAEPVVLAAVLRDQVRATRADRGRVGSRSDLRAGVAHRDAGRASRHEPCPTAPWSAHLLTQPPRQDVARGVPGAHRLASAR